MGLKTKITLQKPQKTFDEIAEPRLMCWLEQVSELREMIKRRGENILENLLSLLNMIHEYDPHDKNNEIRFF